MQTQRIVSRDNERVKEIKKLLTSSDARRDSGLFVAEGYKLCESLARSAYKIQSIWTSERRLDEAQALSRICGAAVTVMSEPVAEKLSDQKSPQGLFAVAAQLPEQGALRECRRVLALCSLQDPHNVGTAVRTARALGFDGVLVSADSADLLSPKTLRGSMGAVFHVRCFVRVDIKKEITDLRGAGFDCIAAALRDDAVPLDTLAARLPLLLAVGNEGAGLPQEIIDACRAAIIPMRSCADSLNAAAAAAIFMWQLRDRGGE